jgi:hypothetical protein
VRASRKKNCRGLQRVTQSVIAIFPSTCHPPLEESGKLFQSDPKIGNLQELPTKTGLQFSGYQKGNFELL